MKKRSIKIERPADAMKLNGIGPMIVHKLAKALKERRKNLGIVVAEGMYQAVVY